jgi:hypothetical protein
VTIETHFINEPLLEFANGQKLEHPQDGLFLYGPVGVPKRWKPGQSGNPKGRPRPRKNHMTILI